MLWWHRVTIKGNESLFQLQPLAHYRSSDTHTVSACAIVYFDHSASVTCHTVCPRFPPFRTNHNTWYMLTPQPRISIQCTTTSVTCNEVRACSCIWHASPWAGFVSCNNTDPTEEQTTGELETVSYSTVSDVHRHIRFVVAQSVLLL